MSTSPTAAEQMPVTRWHAALRSNWIGWLIAVSGSFCFSTAPPIARAAIVEGMDANFLLVLRFAIAVTLFIITNLLTARHSFRMARRPFLFTILAGICNGAAMICFFQALTRQDASITSMILSVLPLVVLVLLAFRGEQFTRRQTLRLALALGGVYLLIGPGGNVDLIGVLLTMIAVFLFSFQLVILQWYLREQDTRSLALYIAVVMLIVITGWWLAQGAVWQPPSPLGWLAALVLGVVATWLARMCLYAGIQRLGSGQTVLLMPVELLMSITWSVLFLDERFSPLQMVGGVLILASALLAIRRLGRARWRPRWRVPQRV